MALVGLAGADAFLERWDVIGGGRRSAEERIAAYYSLTSLMKENTMNQQFVLCMCQHQKQFMEQILNDITAKSCEQAALQLLGYCLHHPQFAACFHVDQVTATVKVLCGTIQHDGASRQVVTRALWCLANQSLRPALVTHLVPGIVEVVSGVILSHRFDNPVVDSEALSILTRLHEQCPETFALVVPTWYKTVIPLLFCKMHKLQRRALSLVMAHEDNLKGNQEVLHWLTKELKDHLIATMVKLLREKGHEHCVILNAWGHFVTLLGRNLHKHGSFLNELLKVVEMGFKNKAFLVQECAYNAWRLLISNFATDPSMMTNPKRLRLLLMPLLASAVKDRHDQVEHARLLTWWHLIGHLGDKKETLFRQVCVPFLLFCLGLDPKLDLSKLAATIQSLVSTGPILNPVSEPSIQEGSLGHDPTLTADKENVQTPMTPPASLNNSSVITSLEQSHDTSILEKSFVKAGTLLSLVASPQTPSVSQLGGGRGGRSSERYQVPPTAGMVLSGCQAVLEFLGGRNEVPGSLIKLESDSYRVFPHLILPLDIAHFFLLFLDGVLLFAPRCGGGMEREGVAYQILTAVLTTAREGPDLDAQVARSLAVSALGILQSSELTASTRDGTRMDVLFQICSLPTPVLGGGQGSGLWRTVLDTLLRTNIPAQGSDMFHECWRKLLAVITKGPGSLSNFLHLINRLDEFAQEGGAERVHRVKMWNQLARKFVGFVKETSEINHGTMMNPDFSAAQQIFKFPFQHIMTNADKGSMTATMETWKVLYDVVSINMSLVVKDPNTCAELVCNDLYSIYGQNAKQDIGKQPLPLHFDIYQNAVAMAIQMVVGKLNWGALKIGDGRGGPKTIRPLLGLLAWQLAMFWDTARTMKTSIGVLMTPHTLSDTLCQLYGGLSSPSTILSATEMLSQPLANLWEMILNSNPPPTKTKGKSPSSNISDLVTSVWKSIMICFQARYSQPFTSHILLVLSPLLVVTLSSDRQSLVNQTLSFWASTFDKTQHLDYPDKLRETFLKYLKSSKSLQLSLPGFHSHSEPSVMAVFPDNRPSEGVSQFPASETQTQSDTSVVLPHPSPRKGVKGSFLNRSPMKPPPSSPEKSPAAKSLDEIIARSKVKQMTQGYVAGATEVNLPMSEGRRKTTPTSALSVRRKLPLGEEDDAYVMVAPAAKKRRLLTEHQREKLRERSDIPTMYNALDPSLDSALLFLSSGEHSEGVPEDPIIIPESEVSPATPISLRRTSQHTTPTTTIGVSLEAMDTSAQSEFPILADPKLHSRSSAASPIVSLASKSPANAMCMMKRVSLEKKQDSDKTLSLVPPRKEVVSIPADTDATPPLLSGKHPVGGGAEVTGCRPTAKPVEHKEVMEVEIIGTSPATETQLRPSSGIRRTPHRRVPASLPPLPPSSSSILTARATPSILTTRATPSPPKLVPVAQQSQSHSSTSSTVAAPLQTQQRASGWRKPGYGENTSQKFITVTCATMQPPNVIQDSPPVVSPLSLSPRAPLPPPHSPRAPLPPPHSPRAPPPPPHSSRAPPPPYRYPHAYTPLSTTSVLLPPASIQPTDDTGPISPTAALFQIAQNNKELLQVAMQLQASHHRMSPSPVNLPPIPTSPPSVQPPPLPVNQQQITTPIALMRVNTSNPSTYVVLRHDSIVGNPRPTTPVSLHLPPNTSSLFCPPSAFAAYPSPASLGAGQSQGMVPIYTSTSGTQVVTATPLQIPGSRDLPTSTPLSSTTGHQHLSLPTSAIMASMASATATFPPSSQARPTTPPQQSPGVAAETEARSTFRLKRGRPCKHSPQVVTATPLELVEGGSEVRKGVRKARRGVSKELPGPVVLGDQQNSVPATGDNPSTAASREKRSNVVLCEPQSGREESATTKKTAQIGTSHVPLESEDPLPAKKRHLISRDKTIENNKPEETIRSSLPGSSGPSSEPSKVETADGRGPEVNAPLTASSSSSSSHEKEHGPNTEASKPQPSEGAWKPEKPEESERKIVSEKKDESKTIVCAASESLPPQDTEKRHSSREPMDQGSSADSANISPNTDGSSKAVVLQTPTHQLQSGTFSSPKTTPAGILKHTSQFDTPCSANKGRRVQFASNPMVITPETQKEEQFKTPKHSRSSLAPQNVPSSRRTLLMPQTPTRMIHVSKSPTTPTPSADPVYPSLADCSSPVEQILPALSPSSKFTHGLIQLVRARNIHTVGNMSSLSEQQVQILPIKSPKIETLRNALRTFEHQLGSKRKSSVDGDGTTPSKQPKVSQPSSSEVGENSSKETKVSQPSSSEMGENSSKETKVSQPLSSEAGENSNKETKVSQPLSSEMGVNSSKETKVSQPSSSEMGENSSKETKVSQPSSEMGENSSKETRRRDTQSQDMETQSQSSILILSTPDSQVSQTEPQSKLKGEEVEQQMLQEEEISASSDSSGADLVEKGAMMEGDVRTKAKSEEASSRDVSGSKPQILTEAEVSPQAAETEYSLDASRPSLAQVAGTEHPVCLEVLMLESSMEEAMEVDSTDARQLEQAPPSLVLHDHSYCSQDSGQPGPVEDPGNETTTADSSQYDSSRTKLSSASQDHTYCSRENTDSVEPSTPPYTSPQPLEPGTESSESQELFSYEQSSISTLSEQQRETFTTEQSSQTEHQDTDTISNYSQTESPDFFSVAVNTDPTCSNNLDPFVTIQSALETVQSASACLSDTGNLGRVDVDKLCLFIRMCSDFQQQFASLLQKKYGSEA